nr:hypothetical protein [Pandoravirus aubagnensis]
MRLAISVLLAASIGGVWGALSCFPLWVDMCNGDDAFWPSRGGCASQLSFFFLLLFLCPQTQEERKSFKRRGRSQTLPATTWVSGVDAPFFFFFLFFPRPNVALPLASRYATMISWASLFASASTLRSRQAISKKKTSTARTDMPIGPFLFFYLCWWTNKKVALARAKEKVGLQPAAHLTPK